MTECFVRNFWAASKSFFFFNFIGRIPEPQWAAPVCELGVVKVPLIVTIMLTLFDADSTSFLVLTTFLETF